MASSAIEGASGHLAHHALVVVLQADLGHELKLRFEEIDVLLGVVENLEQQIARDVKEFLD